MLGLVALGETASLGRYTSSSCPPPNWLTKTRDASPVVRRSSLMSEHSLCTDNTGTSPILSSVLRSDRVMSSPGIAVVDSPSLELEGAHIPSSCFVDADDTMPTSTRISLCSSRTPGKAVQSKTSSTSPGTCMIGSRTSSQKKLLAPEPRPLHHRQHALSFPEETNRSLGRCSP